MAISGTALGTRAMELCGELSPGQSFNTSDGVTILSRLNSIIDSWSIQELMAVASVNATITLIAATESYNLSTRVARVVSASVTLPTVSDMVYPLEILNAKAYNEIQDKYAQSVKPAAIFYDGGFATGAIHVLPIPLAAGTISYTAWAAQTQFASLATSVTLYPGYEEALTAELAVRLCPVYMREPSQELLDMRKRSMDEVRTLNAQLWGKQPVSEGNEVAA